jgi:hypothetical protein
MKNLGIMLAIILPLAGCVTVDHSEVIRTEANGLASGEYRDVRTGTLANVEFGALGGAASSMATTSTAVLNALVRSGPAMGAGAGAIGFRVKPAPAQGDPTHFARSIAIINYSKRLAKIDYDEAGDIIKYEFNDKPLKRPNYQPCVHQSPE